MKSYLKSLTKSLYEKVQRVVQDEYIQPISESQVYGIINRKRKASSSNKGDKQHQFGQSSQQSIFIMQNIQRLGLVTPERQFLLIGDNYSLQVVNYRMKQLKTKIQAVKQHMLNNYQTNLQSIQQALNHLQDSKVLNKTKQKAQLLRQRLSKLQQIVSRTKRITQLNIRIKNIKQTVKILQRVPNLKKMSLFQLKSINMKQLSQFKQSIKSLYHLQSKANDLLCIDNVQHFIDRKVSEHLRLVIEEISDVLVRKFQGERYQRVLKDFVIAKSTIDYQKLIVRLIEGEVRDKNGQLEACDNSNNINSCNKESEYRRMDLEHYANVMFTVCQKYIAILINLSKLLRFHRNNNCAVDNNQLNLIRPRNLSNVSNTSQPQHSNLNNNIPLNSHPTLNLQSQTIIHINTQEVKSLTCALMDQCLKQQIEQILLNSNTLNEQIFQVLALVNNFYQIAFSFTSYIFTQSKSAINQFLMRKLYKLHEHGVNQLSQSLNEEDDHQWNRLPVADNYKYKNIQRTIQRIKRLQLIQKVPHLYSQNFKFLNLDLNKSTSQQFQLQIAQNRQQTFEMNEVEFPYDKLEKIIVNIDNIDYKLVQHEDPVVVICKSSMVVLNYFDQFMQMYCYFPITEIRSDILDKMSFYIDFYIYFLFETFLSDMYKSFFRSEHETVEDSYHHFRVKYLYQEVYEFIKVFKEKQKIINVNDYNMNGSISQAIRTRRDSIEILKYRTKGFGFVKSEILESKVPHENCVKARAIATDSIKYLLAYFSRILSQLKKYTQSVLDQQQQNKDTSIGASLDKYMQKLSKYKRLQDQLSDLLLNDSVPTSTKIDFVVPIMKKIKWNQLQSSKQIGEYGGMILKNVRQVYEKLKSMSKGSMPYYIVDRIFAFYWRTQLTFITKTFLEEHIGQKQKGGKGSKLAFEKLVDSLYDGVVQIVDGKHRNKQFIQNGKSYSSQRGQMFKSSYMKIKSIFLILLQTDWEKCREMVEGLFVRFEFIYKITLSIMRASESCSGLAGSEIEQRLREIELFLSREVLK